MAYFLKKQHQANNTYLAIYESFYSKETKGTKHRCFKSLGSLSSLKKKGIEDPISYYEMEVDKLNKANNGPKKISSVSSLKYLGYFPIKAILEKLNVKQDIDLFKLTTNYQFDLYEILSSLVYARIVHPCSKYKTYLEVIPNLFEEYNFSYIQLLTGLAFYGRDYEKFVEMFNVHTKNVYGIETDKTFFDCTNFYFEIDKQDELRRKGPSKENRNDPIVGLGLLLDKNQIPIGMKIYPGNESEKPVIRNIITSLKNRHNISGKTIQVADKGLNSARNIYEARLNKDGYLFSKSVHQLPEVEKTWIFLENDYKEVKDINGNILYKYKECIDEFPYDFIDDSGNKKKFKVTEKRVVTYNPSLAKKKILEINRLIEKASNLTLSRAKKSEYGEASKYVDFVDIDGKKASVKINEKKIIEDKKLAGYNLLVTSETKLKARDIYQTYHNLWRIEESFRIMKSDLETRPAYAKTEDTIKGHFFICYISVLLERLLQIKELNDKESSSQLFEFFKNYRVVDKEDGYINVSSSTDFLKRFIEFTDLPLDYCYLTTRQIKSILNYKFSKRF